jgi:hypothetical protein
MTFVVDGTNGLTFNDATTQASTATNASNISSGTLGKARLPTGSVLQVVQTFSNTLAAFLRDEYITQLQTSITPTSASSKILFYVNIGGISADSAADCGLRLYRDSTEIATGATGSNTNCAFIPFMNQGSGDCFSASFMYLDSPATTSAIAYKVRNAINSGRTMYWNRRGGDSSYACSSSVILMEIAA